MLALVFLLHIEQRTGSYAAAGLMLAATSVGQATAGPLMSRMMGRVGMRTVLGTTVSVCVAATAAIAWVPMSVPWYVVVGLLVGITTPPVQPAVRTIYPKMVNASQLTPLYSLDAAVQEVIWVIGPVVAAFLATGLGTVWALLLTMLLTVGGGAWFISCPELGRVRIPRSKRRFGAVLTRPPIMLATVVGFLLIAACAAIEAGVVSAFGHGSPVSGFVLAAFSTGSLIGGFAFGHKQISPWSTARRSLIIFLGMALATLFLNAPWLAVTLFIAGLGIAPVLTVISAIVSSNVKFADTAEAFGWLGTGELIGAALGSATAGFLIDSEGPTGALWAAAGFAFFTCLVPTLARRWHPDLRGRDVSPVPDTEPIPMTPS
ncbi:MAG: MFS transporter [Candidatus Lumbricidophila eiseniae]|uniref:MFS transporter n=1 Tax=Candidatus Lumbricidiphila eiseniae TaxID=1969409 RepID=A0A2A6FQZ3_9MICO|nr:MAG: MFS transporter [Candidatus Lumbricidophila eiseniae]